MSRSPGPEFRRGGTISATQDSKTARTPRSKLSNGVAARRTDALFKEYARLSTIQHGYIKSSFDDFKMLSAASGIAGFVITAGTFLTKGRNEFLSLAELRQFAFVAFLGLLALVAILGFRDLLKQSVITGLTVHLGALEATLRERMSLRGTTALLANSTSHKWFERQHRWIAGALQLMFYLAVGAIPCGVLLAIGADNFAVTYVVVAGILLVAHAGVAWLILRFTHADALDAAKGLGLFDPPANAAVNEPAATTTRG